MIILLALASSVVDFTSSSSAIDIGKSRYSSSKKKPPGYPVLKGPYSHQVSLIYSVSILIKLGLKYYLTSLLYICI